MAHLSSSPSIWAGFKSQLFRCVNDIIGTRNIRTTAYNLAANGIVLRFHCQLKAAIKCRADDRWSDTLPTVLLGIRVSYREDLHISSAKLMHGETIRFPSEFCAEARRNTLESANMVKQLREGLRHGNKKMFLFNDLKTTSHVFVRVDNV